MEVTGYEWVGQNFERAVRGSRGVGFLIKQGIKYRTIPHERDLIEEGRSVGIEIGTTQIHAVLYQSILKLGIK